ncbi:MAG: hypothetical protein M5U20_05740 [Phycisphaerales bacterium]|nr:hypothetical protein [Phycisphaerales bacterium]
MPSHDIDRERADLNGRSVFVVGSRYHTRIQREKLASAGATVICSEELGGENVTRSGDAELVTREILGQATRPDAVVIHHPRMGLYDGELDQAPALVLARNLKAHGIPTLIIDDFGGSASKLELIRRAGVTFHRLDLLPAKTVPRVVARMIDEQEQRRSLGTGM